MTTTTTATPLLDTLNAEHTYTTDDKTFETFAVRDRRTYAVGKWGTSFAGTSGEKIHLLTVLEHVEVGERHQRYMKVGGIELRGCTSGNSTRTAGRIIEGMDLDAVTCAKCKAAIERMNGR